MKALALLAIVAITSSCSKNEESPPKVPTPTTPVAPVNVAKAEISSIQLNQDCPDAKAESAKADEPAKTKSKRAKREADSASPYRQPCRQSAMQLAFTGQGDVAAKVQITQLRLITAGDELLVGTVSARQPTRWNDTSYQPWDGIIPASTDVKASYKLSNPDWAAVERNSGNTSFGPMFFLEVDIEIDGVSQTVRSPQFTRIRPHIMKT